MTKPKWTPGPWKIEEAQYVALIRGEDGVTPVCTMTNIGTVGNRGDRDSNARLIAQAPEMAIALKVVAQLNTFSTENPDNRRARIIEEARAILAKIEGEGDE